MIFDNTWEVTELENIAPQEPQELLRAKNDAFQVINNHTDGFQVINTHTDFDTGFDTDFENQTEEELDSSSEFDSLPDEFIPSNDEDISVNNALVDDLMLLGPEQLIQKMKQCSTPQHTMKDFGFQLPPQYHDYPYAWELVKDILIRHVYVRPRLAHLDNSIEQAVKLIDESRRIVVVTGAGISVAAGIPDFRSEESGLYARIRKQFPDLPAPESMFDLEYFLQDPKPFYSLCRSLVGEQVAPTNTHRFIKNLEERGKLLMNFTQNIDTLEAKAGIENVLYCHGSFSSAHCLHCRHAYTLEQFQKLLPSAEVVICSQCCMGLVKPDIVFFGEALPEDFHMHLPRCMREADLLIVIGSSLKVQPVASIPDLLPPTVPQVLINLERITDHNFDLVLLGDCQQTVFDLLNR